MDFHLRDWETIRWRVSTNHQSRRSSAKRHICPLWIQERQRHFVLTWQPSTYQYEEGRNAFELRESTSTISLTRRQQELRAWIPVPRKWKWLYFWSDVKHTLLYLSCNFHNCFSLWVVLRKAKSKEENNALISIKHFSNGQRSGLPDIYLEIS